MATCTRRGSLPTWFSYPEGLYAFESSTIKCSAWGHSFEKFLLADKPNEETDHTTFVLPSDECNMVLKTKVGEHSILYSGEVDGVCAKHGFDLMEMNPKENVEMLKNCHLVEVKTCSESVKHKIRKFKRHKSRQWWIQAALGGASHVIVGYRNDKTGIVRQIESIPVEELYTNYGLGWYGESGYAFLGDFLSEVKARIVEDERVYLLSFKKDDQVGNDFEVLFEQPEESSEYMLPDLI